MPVSHRQDKLIHLLMQSSGYVHASVLADCLHVSAKTVYREIAAINDIFGQEFIEKKPGRGVKIQVDQYSELLGKSPAALFSAGISAAQRRKYIFLFLLLHSPNPVSILKIAELTMSSPTSVAADLAEIDRQLTAGSLAMALIKNKRGTFIQGREKDIRRQISQLLKNEALSDNLSSDRFPEFFPIVQELVRDFPLTVRSPIVEAVKRAEENFGFVLENPYYANFCLYLFILIKRYQLGEVEENQECLPVPDDGAEIGRFLAGGLERAFQLRLHAGEAAEISQILSAYRKSKSDIEAIPEENSPAGRYTRELIDEVARQQGIRLRDESLFPMILSHIQLMYNRLKYDVAVLNPLLDKIKLEFEPLFQTVKAAAAELNRRCQLAELTDDEIAYLTLYFQGAFEAAGQRIKAVIICSTGLGTSQFLKSKIEKAFPELLIQAVLSSRAVADLSVLAETELAISTVLLPDCPCPCVVVSSMFNEKDRENIKKKVEEISGNGAAKLL